MPLTGYWVGFSDGARGQHGEDCIHGPGSREAHLDEGNSSGWKSMKKRDAGVVNRHAGKPLDWPGLLFSRPAWGRWYTRASF